jgi:mono/diheme cytochrome c family protein
MRNRFLVLMFAVAIVVATFTFVPDPAFSQARTGQVTFNKDVLPILQKNCQSCHRPGEIGPMSFLTYEATRPWAKAIKEAVLAKKMPPWFADPRFGHFENDRRLSDSDIKRIVDWVDAGVPEGDPKDKPAPVAWNDGWNIKPDVVFEMAKPYTVPAAGTIDYVYFLLPNKFTQDTWIIDGEVRPGNRSVTHHASVIIRPPGSQWMKDAKVGEAYIPPRRPEGQAVDNTPGSQVNQQMEWFIGYVPGMHPQRYFYPERGAGRMIAAGSDIFIEMHYTANGKESQDRTKVGFVLAKEPPQKQLVNLMVLDFNFEIPPQASNYPGHTWATLNEPATLLYTQPHLHMRGKDMEIKLTYPSGESRTLVNVPQYSYLWQTIYVQQEAIELPKGTRIDVYAHWDNSPNNPHQADSTKTVRWGDQSWDEMLVAFLGVVVEPKTDARKLITMRPPAAPRE